MKQEFIEFLNALMIAAPDVVESMMTENIKAYLETLKEAKDEKPLLTDNGKLILKFMQDTTDKTLFKAKDVAEGLYISSRAVSGAFRKLVTDGFCEKVGTDPVIYALTEKGKTFIID